MPGIDTQVTAIVDSHDDANHQGLDAAKVKAHRDYLESQRGAAALALNGINARADLQALVKSMDERIKTLQDNIETELVADRQVAMRRTLAALQALRDQIVQREAAVTTIVDRTGDAITTGAARVDTFARENLTGTGTGSQVLRGGIVVATGVGLWTLGRRFVNWVRGRRPAAEAPAPAPAPART